MASDNKTNHLLGENPIIRKLGKMNANEGEVYAADRCTYKGIAGKLIFFLVMTALGVAFGMFLKFSGTLLAGEPVFNQPIYEDGQDVIIGSNEIIYVIVAGIISIVAPLVATFAKGTIPVSGTLFCASIGFILSWLAITFADQYMAPVLLALVITLIIVTTMGFLYGMGIVRVGQKAKTFIITAMITVCVGSLLVFIGSLIPATQGIVAQLAANPVISIGVSALMVIVGTLFLLVDFDTIRESVENGLPRKYEWYASFGLVFSVIWLYFKVLDLVLKIMGKSKN